MRNLLELPFFQLFARKKKSNGALWVSLVGLGLSAAVFGVTKGKRKIPSPPIQNTVSGNNPKRNFGTMDTAALTEFSEELLQSALNNSDRH